MRKNWVLGIAGVLIAGTLALSTPQITEASVPTVQYAVQAQYETGVLSKQTPVVMASQNGWVKSGDKYYYYKKGVKQTGWKVIKNKRYYFNKKGVMQTGWLESKNKWYYLGEDGAAGRSWMTAGIISAASLVSCRPAGRRSTRSGITSTARE